MDTANMPLPPAEQRAEVIACSISAALRFEIPTNLMLAVAEKEGGRPGLYSPNTNGTQDVGYMQFNTAYLADLRRYGIEASDVAGTGCYSFYLAAWRIRGHLMNDKGDLWQRASNYHSRTPAINATYRADLVRRADRWADWLEERFRTHPYGASANALHTPKQ